MIVSRKGYAGMIHVCMMMMSLYLSRVKLHKRTNILAKYSVIIFYIRLKLYRLFITNLQISAYNKNNLINRDNNFTCIFVVRHTIMCSRNIIPLEYFMDFQIKRLANLCESAVFEVLEKTALIFCRTRAQC